MLLRLTRRMLTISDGVLLMPETTTVFGLPCKVDRGHDLAFGFLWQGSLRNKSGIRQRSSRSFYRLYIGLLKKVPPALEILCSYPLFPDSLISPSTTAGRADRRVRAFGFLRSFGLRKEEQAEA